MSAFGPSGHPWLHRTCPLLGDDTAGSRLLVSYDSAVIKWLADLRLYGLRLYGHLPPGDTELREKICDQIKKDLPEFSILGLIENWGLSRG